jgi:hypothetical protein
MANLESPTSVLAGSTESTPVQSPPALWNPNAAGCWSLIFTPLFGAYLHMKNWQALGEPERAEKSRKWVIASLIILIALVLASVFLPDTKGVDAFLRLAGFALIVSWYYSIGKSQQAYVLARYGKNYVRRGWTKPLLAALLAFFIFLLVVFVIAFIVQAVSSAL